MSSNTSRFALVVGATLALQAGAQLRADFQNEVFPTAGYTGTTDVTITIQNDPDNDENGNYHSRPDLAADGFSARQSSLMHFGVNPSQVPTGATITGANLELFVTNESWTGFSIYEVLRPWDQGEATYLGPTSSESWALPGAAEVGVDRAATPFSTFGHLDAGSAQVPLTSEGVDLVRRWFNGTTPNNGVIVQDYDSWDKLGWSSSEGSNPPHLIVSFSDGTSARVPVVDDTMIAFQPKDTFDGWGLGLSGRDPGYTASLIRWDLSAIPPGVKVTTASMLFTVNRQAASADAGPFDVYPVRVPWTEEANWSTSDGTSPWGMPGAQDPNKDHGPKEGSFPQTCTARDSLCPVSFPELPLLVQKWVDDPSTNHGLLLQNYQNNDDLQLIDSEWPVAGRRPKLTVQFTWDAGGPPGLYPAYAEVYPGERVPMKAFGGAGSYTFSVSGISGATVDPSGNYTAGLFAGQDQVRVQDQGGAQAFATILVLTNSSTVDGGSPITISFPTPSPPVAPRDNFAVTADITSRTVSPASGLVLELSGQALNLEGATLVGGGRLTGSPDAGFLLPVLDTGATLQVQITGAMRAVPSDRPSVTAAVRSGPLVVARATTDVPLGPPPLIETGCSCGPTTGGMGVVLLAGILQMVTRRRAPKPER